MGCPRAAPAIFPRPPSLHMSSHAGFSGLCRPVFLLLFLFPSRHLQKVRTERWDSRTRHASQRAPCVRGADCRDVAKKDVAQCGAFGRWPADGLNPHNLLEVRGQTEHHAIPFWIREWAHIPVRQAERARGPHGVRFRTVKVLSMRSGITARSKVVQLN